MWLRQMYHLMELRRNQWLKPSDLAKIQQKRLRAIIRHAYCNINFYHKKFKLAGVKPDDIKTVEDLPKIPMTTKSEVRNAFRTKTIIDLGVDLSRCHFARTTGATGEPVTLLYDEKAEDFQKAVAVRSLMEIGGRVHDRWAMISSPQRIVRAHAQRRWFQRFGFLSPTYLSVFNTPQKHLSILKNLRPDIISGYSSSIWLLARAIRESGIKQIEPRIIYGTAEVLSERMRGFINSTFDLEMFDLFGCVEVGRSAWECKEHVGYHMDIDALAMEFVNNNEHVESGERGCLLYTSLYNYAMPLIRYDVGDVCVPTDEQCPCGRGLPLIKRIEGRNVDFITTPSGKVFSGIAVQVMMREILGVALHRVIQERKDRFTVWMVKDYDFFSSETISQIQESFREHFGDVTVNVKVVEDMPKDKSAKHRWIVSKVNVN